MKRELKILSGIIVIFILIFIIPLSNTKVTDAILEGLRLLQWYARNHTLACVVPAMFIAGAIITFLSKDAVMRYLGPNSNRIVAYGLASVSGTILAVCSCSVLPMFAGIWKLGAGLGPASTFLYSGPAINILAIFLTARVLGFKIGLARAIGAVVFSILVGLLMALVFRKEERARANAWIADAAPAKHPWWQKGIFFVCLVMFLIFSDWFNPGNVVVTTTDSASFKATILQEMADSTMFQLDQDWNNHKTGDQVTLTKTGIANIREADTWVIRIHHARWYLAGLMLLGVLFACWRWLEREELRGWMVNTWEFSKIIVPLLFGGVFVVGFVAPFLPQQYVAGLVGDNSWSANLVASVIGAFWYFATLTEIPITQALMKLGMNDGPVVALLLAGPALSLPSMIVLNRLMGWKKTVVFCLLVVIMATVTGKFFGTFW
ncbi:MAG: permease [bacterium]|nr:permease [Candidatus Sumerlaeota bacterium]